MKTIDKMLEELEKKLPGFSYTIFGYRPGAPVYVQWNHMDMKMQKAEALMPRALMAKNLNQAFQEILNRYELFDRAEEKKKPAPEEPVVKVKRKSPV